MASPQVTPETLITLKIQYLDEQKRTKVPLKELTASTLPAKLRATLSIPDEAACRYERFSDSAGKFIELDSGNLSVYKQLFRAAKAKLKLRLRVIPLFESATSSSVPAPSAMPAANASLLDDLACLRVSTPKVPLMPVSSPYLADSASRIESIRTASEAVRQEMSGLNSYLNDLSSNMAHEYANAFGNMPRTSPTSQTIPDFWSLGGPTRPAPPTHHAAPQWVDPEPNMPRYPSPPSRGFCVCCNKCEFAIPDHHWHCGTCQDGDFDLCQQCLDGGAHCDVPEHYLVKRTLENGRIVSGTSEVVRSTPVAKAPEPVQEEVTNEVPGAFHAPEPDFTALPNQFSRTCNACITIYDDSQFVTCTDCADFDLCIPCHLDGKHGHHPGHTFAPAIEDMILEDNAAAACEPGRNQHHDAICDGCDTKIVGVRYKCLQCPDWDYCMNCFKSADSIHSGHRFAPIYEPLEYNPNCRASVHFGIRCDGPLCRGRKWIVGDRYKCAVCNDTDFCARCEALPTNPHNQTHPLIKFRTSVRNVNVTTLNESENGLEVETLGDRLPQTSSRGTETMPPAPSANAATQSQAVPESSSNVDSSPKDCICRQAKVEDEAQSAAKEILMPSTPTFDAYYVRDYVPDGTRVESGSAIFQTWTMYNPSDSAWPTGCTLRWVGGDHMIDIDAHSPGNINAFEAAATSNSTVGEVPRGAEYSFSVKLHAPEKAGRAVSYWRLYTPDGKPFGHRLWCDIEVVAAEPAGIKKEVVKEEPKHVVEEPQEVSGSQMVFPKLEKESPASSIHATSIVEADAQASSIVSSSPVIAEEAEELLSHDDIESVTVDCEVEDDTTDDGFLTDEDYDIVDGEEDLH